MKKLIVCLMVVGLLLAGCCTDPTGATQTKSFSNCADIAKGWVCANRATIESYMADAQSTITAIQAEFPNLIPAEYQIVIVAAQAVISMGQNTLAAINCPTDAQTAAVANASNNLNLTRAKVNFKRMGKMIP
jgi:hypothetical protein